MVRSRQRNLGCSTFTVNRHRDMTFVSDRMLIAVDTASLLFEPFSKRIVSHRMSLSVCSLAYSAVAAQIVIMAAAATAGLNSSNFL